MSERPLQANLRKMRGLVMLHEDTREFSAALQREFPNIRFLEHDYWLARFFTPTAEARAFQQPPDLRIPYLPDLVSSIDYISVGWFEPENWTPHWVSRPQSLDQAGNALFHADNEPNCRFGYSAFQPRAGHHDIDYGQITGEYARGDKHQRAIVNRVWRVLERYTTNRLALVYDDTGRFRRETPSGSTVWVGRHALAWCAGRPERRIWQCHRPIDAPEAAPIPRNDWRARRCEVRENGYDFAHIQATLQEYREKWPKHEAKMRRVLLGEDKDEEPAPPATKTDR